MTGLSTYPPHHFPLVISSHLVPLPSSAFARIENHYFVNEVSPISTLSFLIVPNAHFRVLGLDA